jgi:hypothetical protein
MLRANRFVPTQTISTSSPTVLLVHITYVEVVPTCLAMPIDMPSGDCHIKLSCIWYSHFWQELLHMFSEIFRPLTSDIIGKDDSEEYDADYGSEDAEVDIAVPEWHVINPGRD